MNDYNLNIRADGIERGVAPAPIQETGEKSPSELYTEYMAVITDLYNKTTPYTQDDYESLMSAMKGLEALLAMDPPPEDLTQEMAYNIQITLYLLKEAGITTSSSNVPEDPLAAMNTWKKQSVQVQSWQTGEPISSQEFMASVNELTGLTHSAAWVIAHIAFDQVTETYLEELKALTELLQLTNEILEALTKLYNIINYVETAEVPPFVFPPQSYGDMPPSPSKGYDLLIEAMGVRGTEEDLVVNGVKYEDMTLTEIMTSAYIQDYNNALKLMEETGCTWDEAAAQQHQTSDVFMAIMGEWGDEDGLAEACLKAFFANYGEVVNETMSSEELTEIWSQLESVMSELSDLLEAIDPTGQVRLEDTTSLAYYLDQIIKDFNSVPSDYADDGKALYWLTTVTDEKSQSMTKFFIDMAISTAQSLASEQKIDMQMQMMLAKSILTTLDETWDSLNDTAASVNRQIS